MTEKPNRKSAGQPPVSAHPAFPVIVALWFSALLAIGSMVLPLSMFEDLAAASGLADTFEAAQPPFGASARIAVALVAAALGALAGVLVARKVAAANARGPASRRAATLNAGRSAKRPISAHDELGEGGIDADDDGFSAPREAFAGRRRALAVTEESARSEFLAFAPLPGQSPNAEEEPLDLLAFEEPVVAEPEDAAPEDVAPKDLASAAAAEPVREPVAGPHDFTFGSSMLSNPPRHAEPAVHFEQPQPAAEPAAFTRQPEPATAAPVAERPLGELGMVELVERFAIALQRHRERADEAGAAAPPPFARAAEPEPQPEPRPDTGRARNPRERPLPVALRPFGFDEPTIDEEADEAEALPDFDFAAALSLDREAFVAAPDVRPEAASDACEEPAEADSDAALEEEFEETAEAGYTSLLAMKNPFGNPREPVRIDDFDDDDDEDDVGEPVVVFPGQAARRAPPAADAPAREGAPAFGAADSPRAFDAPPARVGQAAAMDRPSFAPLASGKPSDPAETERALRDALEKLQKMSGVA